MFIMYGPGITTPVPLEKLFKRRNVAKLSAAEGSKVIKQDASEHDNNTVLYQSEQARQKYQASQDGSSGSLILKAAQIMTSPVVSIYAHAPASEALSVFEQHSFRHLPVISEQNELCGLISERDIYRCICGSGSVCMHCSQEEQVLTVEKVMEKQVLTGSEETDARYISRLFVEQGVDAIPIVKDHQLTGIVTRNDILKAVMQNLNLDLWE
ncbi:MAG: CBS domain-containing protein [Ghiorsea sp.]